MKEEQYIKVFKELGRKEPLPEDLKEEVMNSVDSMKFMLDLADLFFVKPIEANINMTRPFFED